MTLSAYHPRPGTTHPDPTKPARDTEHAARHDAESAPERLHPVEEQRQVDMADAAAEVPCRGAR